MRAWVFGKRINPRLGWLFAVWLAFWAIVIVIVTSPITIPLHFGLKASGRKGLLYTIFDDDEPYTTIGFEIEDD
jgi:hypothetical protein